MIFPWNYLCCFNKWMNDTGSIPGSGNQRWLWGSLSASDKKSANDDEIILILKAMKGIWSSKQKYQSHHKIHLRLTNFEKKEGKNWSPSLLIGIDSLVWYLKHFILFLSLNLACWYFLTMQLRFLSAYFKAWKQLVFFTCMVPHPNYNLISTVQHCPC